MTRLGEVLAAWLGGVQFIGVCRVCWCRRPLSEGARCLSCGGMVARVRLR